MAVFDEIIDEVINTLSSDTQLSDITFIDSFKNYKRQNPLQNNLVTVGVKKIELKDKAFGKYLGLVEGKNFFGKKAEIFVTLNIYVPKNQNGISVVEVFSRICDTLMKDNIKEQILSIESGDIEFNKNANAFVLNCILRLEAFIGNETNEPDITNIIVKGEI